jgi:hypothetical protein
VILEGNVGIGTATPGSSLHVQGNIAVPYNAGGGGIGISDAGGSNLLTYLKANGGIGYLVSDASNTVGMNLLCTGANNYISFSPGNAEKVRILPSGNVGIGTTSPSHALDVVGSVNIDATGSYKKEGTTVLDYDSTRFNVSVGGLALSDALLTGTANTATGYSALANNTTGSYNTASGYDALRDNTTGDSNTASGYAALANNTTGIDNTASGQYALFRNTTGSDNTASGSSTLFSNITGSNNTASGSAALIFNTTGHNNTATGNGALRSNTTGLNNTAVGYQSGRYQSGGTTALTTASNSVFLGAITKGIQGATNQIVIGDTAESIGANTVVLGNDSIVTTALKGNVGIGTTSPSHALDVVGPVNVDATGSYKKEGTTILDYDSTLLNVSVGGSALGDALLTGAANTASGYSALANNTTGGDNTATGNYALRSNTTGTGNTASGSAALANNTTGSYNTASGNWSLNVNSGSNNTATGYAALFSNTNGTGNTASGIWSLGFNSENNNTASGYNSGRYQSGGFTSLTTASNSVFLGATTKGVQGAANQLVLGYAAESIGANSVVLGNDSIATTALKGNVGIGTTTPGAALEVATTWNNVATTFTGIKADVTDTASAADSKLLDLQVGGVSKFRVDPGGNVKIAATAEISLESNGGSLTLGGPNGNVYLGNTSAFGASMLVGQGSGGATLRSDYHFSWSSNTTSYGSRDLFIRRAAAATLQLGTDHATVATGQTIKAHDVVTGTGAALTLSGGTGSVANGPVFIEAGNSVDVSVQGVNKLTIGGGDSRFRVPVYPSASGVYDLGLKGILEWRNGSFSGDLYAGGSVGIGTATPDANAILDVSSTTKAFLPPRMTTTEKNAVASPAAGMVVYDTTLNKLAVYTGAAWEAITSA